MKKIFLILILFPQIVFANDVNFYGFYEARGAFTGKNKLPIAEAPRIEGPTPTTPQDEFQRWDRLYKNKKPSGPPLYLKDNLSFSHKVGIGAKFSNNFDIAVFYNQLWNQSHTNNPDSFDNTVPITTSWWWNSGPPHFLNTAKGWAFNKYSLWNIDFEAGHNLKFSLANIRISAGLRYGEYKQNFNVKRTNEKFGFYSNGERRFFSERTAKLDISGLGPRLGLSIDIPIKKFNLITSANYAVLFSKRSIDDQNDAVWLAWPENETDFNELKRGTPFLHTSGGGYKEKNKNTIIRNLDIQGGIQYTFDIGEKSSLALMVGYRYEIHYGATINCGRPYISQSDPQAVYGKCINKSKENEYGEKHGKDNFISHGPFLRTEFNF